MAEMLILLAGLAAAAAYVLLPLLRRPSDNEEPDDDHDAAAVRHRVALEALRDVETDRRAGSLDEAAYAEQVAQAEQRAALTRAALDAPRGPAASPGRRGRPAVLAVAGLIGAVVLVGSRIPATGLGNTTTVNPVLAATQEAESARQDRIADLLDALVERSNDPAVISALADEYLAGSNRDDLVRAAVSLQLLIELEPGRADAYERIMSAYLRAGDAANARAAHDAYAGLESADPVEVAFYDGLIALRGEGDSEAAMAAFDRFLELAPDDPRAGMIRGLRDEAVQAGE